MAHQSILDVMREGGYDPRHGRPIPIERIYAANTISYEDYKAEVERQRRVNQAGSNAAAISAMEADAAQLEERAVRAGVPRRYLQYAIDLTHVDELRDGGVYIYGEQGTHKTTLACSMLRGWLHENPFGTARFIRSTTLMAELKDTFATRESEALLIAQYASVGLLAVDDLGKEDVSGKAAPRLWELFDRRYGEMLPTIVTSQYSPQEIGEHIGGDGRTGLAIVRRFGETYTPINMGQ